MSHQSMTVKDELCGHELAWGPSSEKSEISWESQMFTDKSFFFFFYYSVHCLCRKNIRKEIIYCLICYSPLCIFVFRTKSPWKAFSQQPLKLHNTQLLLKKGSHSQNLLYFLVQNSATDDGSFVEWPAWHQRALLPFILISLSIFLVLQRGIKGSVLTRRFSGKESLSLWSTLISCARPACI